MRNRFKQPLWLVPLAIAALVAIFGWWGNLRLENTIQDQLRDQLNATLNANVTALEIWTTNQIKFATLLAEEPGVRNLGLRILENPPAVGPDFRLAPEAEKFGNYLRPRL